MSAVMLRDMRTRFFNHGLGFLVVSIWPLAHMGVLLAMYHYAGRTAPVGNSINIFFATGLIPTLAFMYVSRFMSLSLVLNRNLLSFPVVKVVDVMMARAFLEIIAAVITMTFMVAIIYTVGDNPAPYDFDQAVLAYLATLLLAIGIGSLVSVLVMFFEFFVTIYALLMILVYVSSGTLFLGTALPDQLAIPLSWNPIFQCTEWMRSAYFLGYDTRLLSKEYLIAVGAGSLCLGLLLERVFRGKMLQ
ncbi:capsular biosynthesis protein [Rhizobium sp. CNPSo 3464]|uniref:ABC transporter permease n=1 Tax=Rhizobium sp. CNPSo 3464 TaxID=3021406 RepID=UPI00254C6405|nr:capsular biosynthesis protein [Rhizobium sp. CNPSo 3464]MDK4742758.1 capsular biosynthesis protein [Rhizobium sp. CNPSo 3464]